MYPVIAILESNIQFDDDLFDECNRIRTENMTQCSTFVDINNTIHLQGENGMTFKICHINDINVMYSECIDLFMFPVNLIQKATGLDMNEIGRVQGLAKLVNDNELITLLKPFKMSIIQEIVNAYGDDLIKDQCVHSVNGDWVSWRTV